MNKVVEILMRRDNMTREEAEELVCNVQEMLAECGGDYEIATDIIADELGLEPDYIMDLI